MAAEQIDTGNPDGYYFSGIETESITIVDGTSGTNAISVEGTNTNAISVTGTNTNGINLGGTLTNGITIGACTTGIALTGAHTTGLAISGDGTTAISVTSGFTGTNMISLAGTGSNAGIALTGACTQGLYITGDATSAIMTNTGTFTNGINLAGSLTYGMRISACTTGISLDGSATTGINISTNVSDGIVIAANTGNGINYTGITHVGMNFTSATPTYEAYTTAGTGGRNNPFVKIGSWDDPFTIVQTSDHFVPIQVNVKKSGNIAFDTAAARFRVDTNGAQSSSAIGCLQLRQNLAHALASSAILNASVNVSSAVAVGSGSLLGGYFSIEGSGAVTKAGDNDCTPLVAVNNNTGGGIDNVFVALQNGTGTHVDEIVKVAVTNGTADCGVRFEGLTDQILVAGSSSTPLVCDDDNIKFVQIYTDCGASAGDNRGIYNRLYLTSTGGGESLRSYTDVSGTVGTAHGAHISLGFGESTTTGAVTGLGVAGRFTLGLADIAYPATGTLGVIEAEVYSFGASSDPAGNEIAMIRLGNNGNSDGQADVDDDAVAIAFDGWTSATGNMVVKAGTPGAMGNAAWSVRCKMPDGSLAYLNFTASPVTA